MGKKSSENLVTAIEASKSRGLARLLNALSIRHVGARVATVLAEHFGSMDALAAASEEQLSEVMEIGPMIAASVHAFLHSEFGRETIADLKSAGVDMTAPRSAAAAAAANGPLAGKTLVVTGTLVDYTRDEIEALIAKQRRPSHFERFQKHGLCRRRRKGRQQARQSQKARRAGVKRGGVQEADRRIGDCGMSAEFRGRDLVWSGQSPWLRRARSACAARIETAVS